MIRQAILYGSWAALLAFVAFTISNGYGMLSHGARLVDSLPDLLIVQVPSTLATFAVAFLGW